MNGRPACCEVDDGEECPDYLTMCDNHAEHMAGFDYCASAPNYQCYNTPNGRPSCCDEPGGSMMNCPQTQPACDGESSTGAIGPQMVFESIGVGGIRGGSGKHSFKGQHHWDATAKKNVGVPKKKAETAKKDVGVPKKKIVYLRET